VGTVGVNGENGENGVKGVAGDWRSGTGGSVGKGVGSLVGEGVGCFVGFLVGFSVGSGPSTLFSDVGLKGEKGVVGTSLAVETIGAELGCGVGDEVTVTPPSSSSSPSSSIQYLAFLDTLYMPIIPLSLNTNVLLADLTDFPNRTGAAVVGVTTTGAGVGAGVEGCMGAGVFCTLYMLPLDLALLLC